MNAPATIDDPRVIELRQAIHTAVLLSDRASANHETMTDETPECDIYAADCAAFDAFDDMRDAFAAIGIDRDTLRRLGDLL